MQRIGGYWFYTLIVLKHIILFQLYMGNYRLSLWYICFDLISCRSFRYYCYRRWIFTLPNWFPWNWGWFRSHKSPKFLLVNFLVSFNEFMQPPKFIYMLFIQQIGFGNFSRVFKVLKRIDGCMYAVKHSIRKLHQDTERYLLFLVNGWNDIYYKY